MILTVFAADFRHIRAVLVALSLGGHATLTGFAVGKLHPPEILPYL